MDNVISFIQANYVWFIIGIVVVIMTIIGYFAEKTGFAFNNKGISRNKNSEIDEDVNDLNKPVIEEGISDLVKENNGEDLINAYKEEPVVETQEDESPVQDINIPEDKIDLEASNEDLYQPLSIAKEEDVSNDIPDELYAPIESVDNNEITLENVTPFSIETEDSNEQIEDENSEYSRLFPTDPIIINEGKKEEPEEEVSQEDVWNI